MKKIILLWGVISALISSCSPGSISSTKYREHSAQYASGDLESDSRDKLIEGNVEVNNRMVIYNAVLNVSVKNADTLNRQLLKIARKYDGYVVSSSNSVTSFRVSADQLKNALEEISRLGKVKKKSITGEDITEEYNDFEIRLDNARKARERYLELLAKAENVEAALKVEKELERLNGEIDRITGRIERLKHLHAFSTITVQIEQKHKIGIVGYVGVGIYKGIRWLFVRD